MSARGSDDDPAQPDTWHEFPDVPTFSEEGFRLSGNVLEGFEDLMDLTPNAPAASFAAHGFGQSASAPSPSPAADASASPDTEAATAAPRSTDERRQFRNRMSQRRFRERQKARSQTLEAELAETSAQLQQLQVMQTALKTKNQLLEKLVQLNKQADMKSVPALKHTNATVEDLYKQRGFKSVAEPVFASRLTEPALRLTIWETGEQYISLEQVGKLGMQEFSKTYCAYIHQIAVCLAQLSDDKLTDESESPAMSRLHELMSEISSMIMVTCLSNPSFFKDLQNCRFDEGIVCNDAQPPSFYCNVAAHMQYTEAQMQDMMYIRHLFYYKIGQLARERNALLDNMNQAKVSLCHASDKLSQMTNWSDQLRENGAEEYRCHMQFVTAVFRGISTTKQLCTGMVVGFPWLPAINKLVEAEGVRRGEPPMQAFVEDTSGSDLQHAADWTDVDQYLESITERDMNRHVPLLKPGQH